MAKPDFDIKIRAVFVNEEAVVALGRAVDGIIAIQADMPWREDEFEEILASIEQAMNGIRLVEDRSNDNGNGCAN